MFFLRLLMDLLISLKCFLKKSIENQISKQEIHMFQFLTILGYARRQQIIYIFLKKLKGS